MSIDLNQHGSLNKIEWVIVERAVYTASGLNEILAGARYRGQCVVIARAMNYKFSKYGRYRIVRVRDLVKLDNLKEI